MSITGASVNSYLQVLNGPETTNQRKLPTRDIISQDSQWELTKVCLAAKDPGLTNGCGHSRARYPYMYPLTYMLPGA